MKVKPSLEEIKNPPVHLRGLVAEAQALILALIDSGGELTPELEAKLACNDQQLAAKVDGYVWVEDYMELQIAMLKRKEESLRTVRKGIENAQERLRSNIKYALVSLDKPELAGKEYRYKLSKRAPKLVIELVEKLPNEFKMVVTTTVPDKEKILGALKDGFEVPGAYLEDVVALLCQEVVGD